MQKTLHRYRAIVAATALVLCAAVHTKAGVLVGDLADDWSNSSNPNSGTFGTWSLNSGATALSFTNSWVAGLGLQPVTVSTNVSGWVGNSGSPFWFQYEPNASNNFWTSQYGFDTQPGDIIVHSANSNAAVANATWTSSKSGNATISGSVWAPSLLVPNRENDYELILDPGPNQSILAQGVIPTSGTTSRSHPLNFTVSNVSISAGDVVELAIPVDTTNSNNPSQSGWFTATNLTIAVADTTDAPIASAGPTQTAYVNGNVSTPGTGQTYTYKSVEIMPGATEDLAINDELILTDGPLYISPGATFNASGVVVGDIINAGLVHVTARYTSTFTNKGTVVFSPQPGGPVDANGPLVNDRGATFEPGVHLIEGIGNGTGAALGFGGGGGGSGGGGGGGINTTPIVIQLTPGTKIENSGKALVGYLQVRGDYTQLSTGETLFDLGGINPITGYSQMQISGHASLEGDFAVDYINSFTPFVGETFDLFIAGDGITFGPGWSGLQQLPGFDYSVVTNGTGDSVFRATFVGIAPEPASLSLLAAGGLMLVRRRGRAA